MRGKIVKTVLPKEDVTTLKKIARNKRISLSGLIRVWVVEKIQENKQ